MFLNVAEFCLMLLIDDSAFSLFVLVDSVVSIPF